MRGFSAVATVVFACICQVTIAPLFPVSATAFDFVLIALVLVAAFGNPRRAMVAVPVAAVALSFLSGRSAGLLLLAYLPLLPLGLFLEGASVPLNHFARALVATLATGAWARVLLVLGAMVGGAEGNLGIVVREILLPGLFLDFALLSVAYVPMRLIGWSGQGMSLQRGVYYSGL